MSKINHTRVTKLRFASLGSVALARARVGYVFTSGGAPPWGTIEKME